MRMIPLLVALMVVSVHGETPVVTAKRAAAPPKLDGRLDDACWREAPAATDFRLLNTETSPRFGSTAYVCFDDAALYIAVRCDEPNMDSVLTHEVMHDDQDVFRTDCIEIMIDPGAPKSEYFHIAVNASGSIADRACTQGGHVGDFGWDGQVEAASHIGSDHWGCEVRVPFYALGLGATAGRDWAINICREKKKPQENSSLGEQGAFNIASRFATLRGMDMDMSRYRYAIGHPRIEHVLDQGAVKLTMDFPVDAGPGAGGALLLDTWLVSPLGRVASDGRLINVDEGSSSRFTLGPIHLTESGNHVTYIRLADPATKRPVALRKMTRPVDFVPLSIRLIEPWYRNAIFATQGIERVVLDLDLKLDAAALTSLTGQVVIEDAATGRVIAERALDTLAVTQRLEFDALALPEARMRVKATLHDAGGKLLGKTTHPLRKLPAHPGEVWLGRDMQWRIAGELFFLNGAWNYPENFLPDYNAFTAEQPGGVKLLDAEIMSNLASSPGFKAAELSDEDAARCLARARQMRDHPGLFAYYVCDEPEVAGIKPAMLQQVYDVMADEDPYHPIIISNDTTDGLIDYARCADINGLHPYPVILTEHQVNDLSRVAVFMDEARRAFVDRSHKQTMAYLHQGFNYGDFGAVNNRIPSYVEYRSQNLLSLICGGNGFIQFNRTVKHYPELYIGMSSLTREFAYLGPIIVSPTADVSASCSDERMRMLLKAYGDDLVLLACNADMTARSATITIPGIGKLARDLGVISEGRRLALSGDTLTDTFGPFEVHVYTTSRTADGLETVEQVVAKIAAANAKRRKAGNLAFQMFETDGVVVTASTNKASKYRRPDTGLWHVTDGIVDTLDRYHNLAWHDETENEGPDWLELRLPEAHRVGRVEVYPLRRSLRDYAVQAFVGGQWRDVDQVTSCEDEHVTHRFDAVTTDRIRLWITATNGSTAQVTEVEIYEP